MISSELFQNRPPKTVYCEKILILRKDNICNGFHIISVQWEAGLVGKFQIVNGNHPELFHYIIRENGFPVSLISIIDSPVEPVLEPTFTFHPDHLSYRVFQTKTDQIVKIRRRSLRRALAAIAQTSLVSIPISSAICR